VKVPASPTSRRAARNEKRVKKAAPKQGRKGRRGKKKAVVEVTADLLATLPLFELLDDDLRQNLVGRCTYLDIERGEHLFDEAPTRAGDAPVFILLFGDISVHRTESGNESIVNYLSVGDPYVQRLFVADRTTKMRLTAMCPVRAIRLGYRDVNYLLKHAPAFREGFVDRIRTIGERQRGRFDDSLQQDIARFLVAERLTFSGRVKLKRMDICIECDGCYDACKSRHGTDRLGPSEVKYGLTEVPQNCHNCVVPECIDKCKFGHITRDPGTNEIVIADDCTGCTMCAKGCSFGSIRMHPVSELDMAKYFPNRSPDAKGKNIAQKCDNCTGYADQACVTACPAGALFQVDGKEIFDYWQQFNVHQTPGFEDVASPEATPRGWRRFWIALTVINTVLLTWECFGRLYWPGLTFGTLFYVMGWSATGIDPEVPFKAGDFFSHSMGYIGGFFLLCTQLYRLRRWTGGTRALMEAHVWTGILGGIYGLYHTAFVFSEPVAIATFATMMLAIVTGAVGRYLVFLVPRSQAGQQLALGELNEEIQQLNRRIEQNFIDAHAGYTMMMRVESFTQKAEGPVVNPLASQQEEAPQRSFWTGVFELFGDDRRAQAYIDEMAEEFGSTVTDGKVDEVVELLNTKARLERSVRRHGFLAKVLKRYRIVHVTSSNIMFGALVLHVVLSLMYHVGN